MKKKPMSILLGLILIGILAVGCGKPEASGTEPEKVLLGKKVITARSTYDMCGNVLFYSNIEFDEKGREKASTFSGTGEGQGSRTEYTYDDADRRILTEGFRPDGTPDYKKVFTYDDRGLLVRELYSGTIGPAEDLRETVYSCTTYEYDERGLKTRITEFEDAECTAERYRTVFTYSETGKVLTELKEKADGSVMHYNTYEYDERDFLISSDQDIVSIGAKYRSEYKNREDGKALEVHIFRDGEKESISVNEYDEDGNLLGVSDLRPDGTVLYFESYEWIEI